MSSNLRKELRRKEIEMQNTLIRTGSIKTCTNCEYWAQESCQKWNMVPPISVILTGCEDHCEDMPF